MTVPAQRGADTGGQQDALTSFIAESLRRLEDSVSRGFDTVNIQLSKLPEQYVARREFDRYRDEMTLDWQTAVQDRESKLHALASDVRSLAERQSADAKALADRQAAEKDRVDACFEAGRKERVAARRWLIGISSASGIGLAGVITGVIQHFH